MVLFRDIKTNGDPNLDRTVSKRRLESVTWRRCKREREAQEERR